GSGVRRSGNHLHRPEGRRARTRRQQGPGPGLGPQRRHPVLDSTRPSADIAQLLADAESMEFPLFVKAVAGGGGRGMRRVAQSSDLEDALKAAMREAEGAFGAPTVFIEQAVQRPRHLEVQLLADNDSN